MKKYRWIEDVLVFRQSIGIIIILVLTILSVATVYKSKIEEIIIVELKQQIISNSFSMEDLNEILMKVAPDSVKRRFETPQLQKTYEKRMESWKK